MSDLGLLATQLAHTTRYAEDLDAVLLHLKRAYAEAAPHSAIEVRDRLLNLLVDVLGGFEGNDGRQGFHLREETVESIRSKHSTDWEAFIRTLKGIQEDAEHGALVLSAMQLQCLEDVAQALDVECSLLFERMQGRHR